MDCDFQPEKNGDIYILNLQPLGCILAGVIYIRPGGVGFFFFLVFGHFSGDMSKIHSYV